MSAPAAWYPRCADHPLHRVATRLLAALTWPGRVALWVAAALMLVLALLTAALVLFKAVGFATGNFLSELQWHLFGAGFLFAAAWCLRVDGHVRVDVLHHRLPLRARAAIDALGLLLFALPLCTLVVYHAVPQTLDMYRLGEGSGQSGGIPRFWPIYACLPLGFALLGLQVVGQALSAAVQTVPAHRPVHSLHSYFLRPGDTSKPIVYEVDRIRDGKSFTTRRVVAIQSGRPIFNLSASFQIEEEGFDHHDEMPEVRGPDGLPSELELWTLRADKLPELLRERATAPRPVELRPVDQTGPEQSLVEHPSALGGHRQHLAALEIHQAVVAAGIAHLEHAAASVLPDRLDQVGQLDHRQACTTVPRPAHLDSVRRRPKARLPGPGES